MGMRVERLLRDLEFEHVQEVGAEEHEEQDDGRIVENAQNDQCKYREEEDVVGGREAFAVHGHQKGGECQS